MQGVAEEVIEVMSSAKMMGEEFQKLMTASSEKVDVSKFKGYYSFLAKAVAAQKKRIGGNFVISNAVTSRIIRDHIKTEIPDCIFVTLTLSKETQKKRIFARHGGGEESKVIIQKLITCLNAFELPEQDEKNTYNVDITEDMSPENVMDKVLKAVE